MEGWEKEGRGWGERERQRENERERFYLSSYILHNTLCGLAREPTIIRNVRIQKASSHEQFPITIYTFLKDFVSDEPLLTRSPRSLNSKRTSSTNFPPLIKTVLLGFPGGPVVENLPANAGDTGLSPGLGRSHMPRSN